jgi:hypothetical protein
MVLYLQVRAIPGDVEMRTMKSLRTNVVARPVCCVGLTHADPCFHWSPISLLRREVIEMCHKGAGITWYSTNQVAGGARDKSCGSASKPGVRPTQPHIRWLPGALDLEIKRLR